MEIDSRSIIWSATIDAAARYDTFDCDTVKQILDEEYPLSPSLSEIRDTVQSMVLRDWLLEDECGYTASDRIKNDPYSVEVKQVK